MRPAITDTGRFFLPLGMLQTCAQLSQYNPTNPAENTIFATSVGPQEALSVAKITSAVLPASYDD